MARVEVGRAALSRRELEVAALVAEGLTNRAIAQRMFISERTVDGHLEHIREKLGVSNRAQVATWFVAQPPNGAGVLAAPSPSRPQRRIATFLVAIAALIVLALVAVIGMPRLFVSNGPSEPALTSFSGATPTAQFNRPQSVAIGGDGFIYVADTDNFAIKRIDQRRRTISIFAGGVATGQFVDGSDSLSASIGNPTSVAVAPDGKTIYFANGFIVGRIDPDSTAHIVAGRPMKAPVGLAFALDGTLYIADLEGNSIWQRAPDGRLSVFAGTGQEDFTGDNGPARAAALARPRAVALDAARNVLIADTGNNRIRQVDRVSNVITTVAGSSDVYGFGGDGRPAVDSKLSLPYGVVAGRDGNLYIADTGNNRVRRVTPAGIITTVVGGQGTLKGPAGLAISNSGDVYIATLGDSHLYVAPGLAAR